MAYRQYLYATVFIGEGNEIRSQFQWYRNGLGVIIDNHVIMNKVEL